MGGRKQERGGRLTGWSTPAWKGRRLEAVADKRTGMQTSKWTVKRKPGEQRRRAGGGRPWRKSGRAGLADEQADGQADAG